MKKTIIFCLTLCLVVISTFTAVAGETSVGLKASTLGGGIEVERSFNDRWGGRLGLNYFTYNYDGTEDDISYDFDLDLFTVAAFFDWHPFAGSFRVTAGGMYNGNELNASGTPSVTYDIGDATYTAAEVGDLDGTIDFDDFATYAGIGWNTSFGDKKSGWGFIADIGVVFQGKPDARLSANGTLANDPIFQENLSQEQQNLQEDLDEFELYPVIAVGVTYSF